jgi:NAD(P)-dependent dehydrogenase (short-subunit alcohol dehydrogenase family)
MGEFDGKTVIVTGAGDGIGRASARRFAAQGANLVLIDVKGVDEIAGELTKAGAEIIGATMDVRDANGWSRLVDKVQARFGGIDALVNNAGIAVAGDTAVDASEEVWDRIMDINAKGVWLGMKSVLPIMIARKRGKICNVASTAAHIGLRDAAVYCASKGAVLALTRQAGVQYAPLDIQINSVSPGTTMTGLQRDVTEAQRTAFLPLTPIGRFAEPDEVARVIVFLCSPGSSFMTGVDVSVDGGMVAL